MRRDLDLLALLQEEVILRIYQWDGSWVSYGYFQTEAEAKAHFPEEGLQFVQRPTGGGLVDHRHDLTYTLLIPKTHPLALLNRAESYHRIHQTIHLALTAAGIGSLVVSHESGKGSACFGHPVPGDIVDPDSGRKLAGAAQRRSRQGLLHQGSILAPGLTPAMLTKIFLENTD